MLSSNASIPKGDVIRTLAEWERARIQLQFESPFAPPTQASLNAVAALGDTGMAAAGLVVVNRILRMRLGGHQPGVQLMLDLQRAACLLQPLGVSVDMAKNMYTIRYDNGAIQIQHAKKHKGIDVTVSLGVAEHLDALVITTLFAHLSAAGYRNIVADKPPRLDNIVLHGQLMGWRFDDDAMRATVRQYTGTLENKRGAFKKACIVKTQYHKPDAPRGAKKPKCVFLFFDSGAMVGVNMNCEARASLIMAVMLPMVWPYVIRDPRYMLS